MEQGGTSLIGVTTRARSGAHPQPPRESHPPGIPRPKAKEASRDKPANMSYHKPRSYVEELVEGIITKGGKIDNKEDEKGHPVPFATSTRRVVITTKKTILPDPSPLVGPHIGTTEGVIQARVPRGEDNAGGSEDVIAKLQRQVEEIDNMLKDIAPSKVTAKHCTLLPFSHRLRHKSMPKDFRMPKFKTYDGMGYPSNHTKAYDSQLSLRASEDDVYARAFPSSLIGAALKWFHKLPPDTIDCWQDFMDVFMDKFEESIVAEQDEEELMNLK
ncbi:hypothetical protein LIER_34091 [Lithospermum erythrorhizon]|uniref:Retrotransposon gag domain-containing protein n=1 Tax=Lithospermum erythrorhizon TaxID=34254 RepID=A0AAV3S0D9_LITER